MSHPKRRKTDQTPALSISGNPELTPESQARVIQLAEDLIVFAHKSAMPFDEDLVRAFVVAATTLKLYCGSDAQAIVATAVNMQRYGILLYADMAKGSDDAG